MQNGNGSTTVPTKMSFSITKQTKKTIVKSNFLSSTDIIELEDEETHSQKRKIAYLENGIIKDADDFPMRKKEKNEYLIPMKRSTNDWRIERLKKIIEEGNGTEEDKARLALLIDAFQGDRQESVEKPSNAITFINDDVEGIDADYQKIPVDEFGLAFLRGCGWKKQDGIGSKNRKAVPLRVSEPRPKGLGVGANISATEKQKDLNGKKKGLEKNVRVKILSGTDRGLTGQVRSMDEDNSSCFVELDGNRKIARVSQFALEVIDKKT